MNDETTDDFGAKCWHVNAGICYSRLFYTDKAAAERMAARVRKQGRTANGGFYHGMPLGSVSEATWRDLKGWEVTC